MDVTCLRPLRQPPLLLLLTATTLMMMTMMGTGDMVSAAKTRSWQPVPFRGEMSAVPRGLEILLGNVASPSAAAHRKPGNAGNDLLRGRSSPGKSRSYIRPRAKLVVTFSL